MKNKLFVAVLAVGLSACSTMSNNPKTTKDFEKAQQKNITAYSKHVAFMPYHSQGVTVAGSETWYYGDTPGLSAFPAEGGVLYVMSDNEGSESRDSKNAHNGNYIHYVNSESAFNKDGDILDADFQAIKPLARVHFHFSKSDVLYESSEDRLKKFLSDLVGMNVKNIHLIGYTDDVGTDNFNIPLSRNRADYIAEKIKEIRSDVKITTEGRGSYPRIASNEDAKGRILNRRVEVFVF